MNNVFISCIVNDVYKEFQMDMEQVKDLRQYLKQQFSKSQELMQEDVTYLKQAKLLHKIASGSYLNLEEFYDEEDSRLNTFLKKVLSKLHVTVSFEMNINDVQNLLYSMGRHARSGRTEEYQTQDVLVSHGMKNTEYLEKLGIKIKENQFVFQEDTKEEVETREGIHQFIKKEKKRA